MAFNDTQTRGDAIRKAIKSGATHFFKLMGGYKDREIVALWFFKGNTPITLEQCQKINPDFVSIESPCYHEVANYSTTLKSFAKLERVNNLVKSTQLHEIDDYYFENLQNVVDFQN